MNTPPATRADAETLDLRDPLAHVRAAFDLPQGVIYLDGHSLGPATHAALRAVDRAARTEWASGLIRSWNSANESGGWIDLPARTGARIARLVGAAPEDVIVCDSVSVNLFKLAAAALPFARTRTVIVEADEFPTDQYIAEGLCNLAGARLIRAGEGEGADALAREGGVFIRSVVNYRTARVADMAALERIARDSDGLVLWDLSHAAGVIDIDLRGSGARLAAGCTYKYLNGGPGAPAYVFVHTDLSSRMNSPLSGWMGHAAPFAFAPAYAPQVGVARFASGTPGILSLSALSGALDVFDHVSPASLAAKARALGELCLARAKAFGLETSSPIDPARRGGHVSLVHEQGYAIVQALIARGVIADFRAPDTMRFGFSPLYMRHVDVWDAMDALGDILATRAWDAPAFHARRAVT